MKKKNRTTTLYLVEAALIGAFYVVLCYLQEMILPSSASGIVQVRLSEVLCVLAVFSPSAIYGLTVGCFISNLLWAGIMPMDILLGTFATFLAALCGYLFRNFKLFKVPLLSLMMPVILNGLIVGLELELFYIKGGFEFAGFFTQAGIVALGEFIACVILGIPFYFILMKTPVGFGENRK